MDMGPQIDKAASPHKESLPWKAHAHPKIAPSLTLLICEMGLPTLPSGFSLALWTLTSGQRVKQDSQQTQAPARSSIVPQDPEWNSMR